MNIRPKKLHHSEQMERKATWLELFFDLSLVVPIYQLSHYLVEHLSFVGILSYIVLFMAVFQTWQHNMYYNEQFELPEKFMRVFTLIKILLLICMTAFIPTALGVGKFGFVVTFCLIRLFMTVLWTWGAHHNPELKNVTKAYSIGTLLGTLLLISSLWLPEMAMLLFWLMAIIIDIILPVLIVRSKESKNLSLSDHIPERFGLFFLILLGEGIISLTLILITSHAGFAALFFPAVLGLLLVFGVWWLYIDNIMAKPIHRESASHRILWQQGHLGLFLTLPALGASITFLLEHFDAPHKSGILFVTVVLILLLFFLGIIERSLNQEEHAPCQNKKGLLWRGLAILFLFFLMMFPWWPAWVIFLILNGIIWAQVLISGYCHKKV